MRARVHRRCINAKVEPSAQQLVEIVSSQDKQQRWWRDNKRPGNHPRMTNKQQWSTWLLLIPFKQLKWHCSSLASLPLVISHTSNSHSSRARQQAVSSCR